MNSKNCTKCGKLKPFEGFVRKVSHPSGRASHCKECQKKTRQENRESLNERAAAYRKRNRDLLACKQRDYFRNNKEAAKATSRRAYQRNAEYYKGRSRSYYHANKEKQRSNQNAWRESNRTRYNAIQQTRRAKVRGAPGHCSSLDVLNRFLVHGNKCIYCGREENLTVEHLIPLSRGGSNWPANLAPSCRTCNNKKYTKTHLEFLEFLRSAEQ